MQLHLLAAAIFPAVIWLGLFWWKDRQREPRSLLFKTTCWGIITAVPIVLYRYYAIHHREADLWYILSSHIRSITIVTILFFLIVALVEEYVKHVAMIRMVARNTKEVTQSVDGVIYAVAAAMGFALLENYVYFTDGTGEFLKSFLARALGATLGHAVFSGIFGAFAGKAFFAPKVVKRDRMALAAFHESLLKATGLHLIRTHVIPGRATHREHSAGELMAEGYWVAVILHWMYNVSLTLLVFGRPIVGIATFILVFGFAALIAWMGKHENQRIRKAVANVLTIPEWLIPTTRARRTRREIGLSPGL